MDLLNAILAYAMAGAFVLWLVAEDQEREGSSRVLRFVGAVIVALLFVGEDRDYHWWIALCVVVALGAQGIALATALLGPLIPAHHLRPCPTAPVLPPILIHLRLRR